MTASPPHDSAPKPMLSPREARLKAALRENLRRRKAAARTESDARTDQPILEGDDTSPIE